MLSSIITYLRNLFLRPHLLKFSIVGSSGVLVNMFVLYALTEYFKIYYMVSSIIAIELSILANFTLNEAWTWADRKKSGNYSRIVRYHLSVGIAAVLANGVLLVVLTEIFDIYYLISNLIGIAAGMLLNFVINDLWTFAGDNSSPAEK
ncbi:MAG: GtrA family protein [Calditrichaceae bacterium]